MFPLQCTRKDYAQTQKKENRSNDIDLQIKLRDILIEIRKRKFENIKDGLPEVISAFMKELLNAETVYQKLMIVFNVQYALDDWCSEHLLDKRKEYIDAVRQLTARKEKSKEMSQVVEDEENNLKKTKTEKCENLAKLLLDMSVGIESIFREISEVHDTRKTNDRYLTEGLGECNRQLPEVAAKLLMKGVSVELMDGDGLFVPTEWLEEVLISLEKCFQETYGLSKAPKIYVLTVLGAQSTGKSTLLNTMFGIQFPVSAGRCTKGAFMQLVPIIIENFPYNGLLVIDTEGLGAPEYRQNKTHDNEIATFVLGISDLAIINVFGESPIGIEDFLQVSITALMRMNLAQFHPSVVFVHQNCDPSSETRDIKGRYSFMKTMDNVVSDHAKLIQKSDKFSCFQDVVDVYLEDDFVFFPPFLEGAAPMSPPSRDYSLSCFDLRSCILSKMEKQGKRFNHLQTLRSFSKKVEVIWNGILEEDFVLSLRNSAEIQVKYDVDNCKSNWKVAMESYMEVVLEELSGEIEAEFKAKEPSPDLLSTINTRLTAESHSSYDTQKNTFTDYIKKQERHQEMYNDWEQKCINKMDHIREDIMEDCKRRLSDFYSYEKNAYKWKHELQQSKNELQEYARKNATELLDTNQKGEKPEFTNEEIEDKFNEFWSSVKCKFLSKKVPASEVDNVSSSFVEEIREKSCNVPGFKKILEKFGFHLENRFSIEWIELSHVEFTEDRCSNTIHAKNEFSKNIKDLMESLELRILSEVVNLCDAEGFLKMKFKANSKIFSCGSFVKHYLIKVQEMLIEAHDKSPQKDIYNLRNTFKIIFLCFAAQIAIPNFEKAQQSFINYMDNSYKLDSERENIKQLFTRILKKEETLTIAAKQITNLIHRRIKDKVVKDVTIHCKDMLLRLVTLKIHVHGLVLHDVVVMLEKDINDENLDYIQKYFQQPFDVFREKISHVFDGCQNIRLNDMMREEFDAALKKMKQSLQYDLQASPEKSLTEVMCQNQSIRSLGIGEKDFAGIAMPSCNTRPYTLHQCSTSLPDIETSMINKKFRKRMEDEEVIIKKVINLIMKTDELNADITAAQQGEIKKKVINDVNNHLFMCTELCPLCQAPCNETHSEGDGQHSSGCHRPQGIANYLERQNDQFVTLCCNDLIKSDRTFSNAYTNHKPIAYKDYQSVNNYYKSWSIKPVQSVAGLYWKFITYHVTKNLHRFFPRAKKANVSQWEVISRWEAIKNINSLFHLNGTTITKNEDGFHIIKSSEFKPTITSFQLERGSYFPDNTKKQTDINRMGHMQEQIKDIFQKVRRSYRNTVKNSAKSKHKLQENEGRNATKNIYSKQKDKKPEVTTDELENKFNKFRRSKKESVFSKKLPASEVDDVTANFVKEIREKYCGVPSFNKIIEKFGFHLENMFNIEWIELSHVEFIENRFYKTIVPKNTEFLHNIEDMMTSLQTRILTEVINLCDAGGFLKLKFEANSNIFNCGSFIKHYLVKVQEMLIEAHNRSPQKNIYNLRDTLKIIFSCFAAQIAIPNFKKAQQSFIVYMDIPTKLDSERENIKQFFTLILKKEVTLTNAAKQITEILYQRIKDEVVKDVTIHCKDMLLGLVSQGVQVHGLVLHDVVAMFEKDISDKNLDYIQKYFQHPFDVFREKISHVFDGYQDIRLNGMMGETFNAVLRGVRQPLQSYLQALYETSLTDVMCQELASFRMPKFNKTQDNDRLMAEIQVRQEREKSMIDENDIVKKLTNLIVETDVVSLDITVAQQDEIKKKVINDVNKHLFVCTKLCPLCRSPCEETHSKENNLERIHSSRHHRPQGIATYIGKKNKEFVTSFCNDLIKSNRSFSNADTKYKSVAYSNYKSVNSYYQSWNVEAVEGGNRLYWKYIAYYVTENLHRLFPKAKNVDVSQWKGISKGEAIRNIKTSFHLDEITLERNEDGFHVIPSLEKHLK